MTLPAERIGLYTQETPFLNKVNLTALCVLLILVIAIFAPMVQQMVLYPPADHVVHFEFIRQYERTGTFGLSHFLYHALVADLRSLAPAQIPISTAGLIVEMIFRGLLAVLIYYLFYSALGMSRRWQAALYVLLTISLMLVTPINLFTFSQQNLYFGYNGINTYHNPTVELLKPLALAVFLYLLPRLLRVRPAGPLAWLTAALLNVLSTLAKPNYTIVILPLFCLLGAYRFLRRQPFNWPLLIWGTIVPTALLLAWQYFFLTGEMARGVGFQPFLIFRPGLRMTSLSLLFPIAVYLLYFNAARKEVGLNLAWGGLGIAMTYMYLFYEIGEPYSRNFGWGGRVTLLIVFIFSMLFLLRQRLLRLQDGNPRPVDWRYLLCMAIFGAHLLSGVVWYYVHLFLDWRNWW